MSKNQKIIINIVSFILTILYVWLGFLINKGYSTDSTILSLWALAMFSSAIMIICISEYLKIKNTEKKGDNNER